MRFAALGLPTLGLVVAGALAGSLSLAQAAESWDMPTPYPDGNFHTQNVCL